ncbi:MAG: DUF4412 domain-containing protein [Mariniphaga sp.]
MKNQLIILFLALIIIVPIESNAQFGNFIKNNAAKALNAIKQEKVKESTSAIDSAAQQKAAAMEKESNTQRDQANKAKDAQDNSGQAGVDISRFLGGKVDLKYKDDYSFSSRLYMVMETYNKKETMKIDLFMYFSGNSPSVGMETKSFTDKEGKTAPIASSMVMDGENKCFIILTDMGGTKMGMISAIPDETNKPEEKPDHKMKLADLKKTGNTKEIAGYKCDEYVYTDSENKSTGKLWFTKDVNLKIDKRGWSKTGMGTYYGYSEFEGGIILGNEAYDGNGKLTMKSEAKEINPNFSHSISVKGYALRQMNFNQGR